MIYYTSCGYAGIMFSAIKAYTLGLPQMNVGGPRSKYKLDDRAHARHAPGREWLSRPGMPDTGTQESSGLAGLQLHGTLATCLTDIGNKACPSLGKRKVQQYVSPRPASKWHLLEFSAKAPEVTIEPFQKTT